MKKLVLFGIMALMSVATMATTLGKVDQVILAKEDTYISTDAPGANYGSDALMKPKGTKTFNRMSIMKFEIPEADIKAMKGAQVRVAITFGSGAEEANYSIYAFHNLKWSEKDATYGKLESEIALDKGVKLGEMEFVKDSANDPKYYYVNITDFAKKHGKNEFTLMLVDDKQGNKNINLRAKEHSEKWAPAIEIEK